MARLQGSVPTMHSTNTTSVHSMIAITAMIVALALCVYTGMPSRMLAVVLRTRIRVSLAVSEVVLLSPAREEVLEGNILKTLDMLLRQYDYWIAWL